MAAKTKTKTKNCFQTCQVTVSSFSSRGLPSVLLSCAPAVPQAFRVAFCVAVFPEPVFTTIVRILSLLSCVPSLTLDLLHICETDFSFFLRKSERYLFIDDTSENVFILSVYLFDSVATYRIVS